MQLRAALADVFAGGKRRAGELVRRSQSLLRGRAESPVCRGRFHSIPGVLPIRTSASSRPELPSSPRSTCWCDRCRPSSKLTSQPSREAGSSRVCHFLPISQLLLFSQVILPARIRKGPTPSSPTQSQPPKIYHRFDSSRVESTRPGIRVDTQFLPPLFCSRNSTCFFTTGSYFNMLSGRDVRGRTSVR